MLSFFRFLLGQSKTVTFVAIIAGLVSAVANTGLIALINETLANEQGPWALFMWGFAGLCALMLLGSLLSGFLLYFLSFNSAYRLQLHLSRQILATPLRKLEELGPHRLLVALTEDIQMLAEMVRCIPSICIDLITFIGCLIYVGWLSWQVLLGLFGFLIVTGLTYAVVQVRAERFLRQARDQQDALFSHFRALTDGTKELQLNSRRRHAFFRDLLQPTAWAALRSGRMGASLFFSAGWWGQTLLMAFVGLLLFGLPSMIPNTDRQVLSGYTLAILYLLAPLGNLVNLLPVFSRAGVVLNKIDSLGLSLSAPPQEIAGPPQPPPVHWRRLQLVAVTHSYHREREDSSFTLGPISFEFQPGEIVFLIGGNGSGKTTLAKLITGLYTPEDGQIVLDGNPITNDNRDSYRQLFSAVFADFYLFDRLLGLDAADADSNARHYLTQLQLHHKVTIDHGALSTIELSQGQRKRLALLTAYLEDRPFYVFDEWAADQDPVFRELFYTQLLPELKRNGKTVLVITHDDRYFATADRIFKLDYGRLATFADPAPLGIGIRVV